ncbi:hypothetical protein NIES4071_91440 [Calothrix sp. NIES-4071]|nr:hypothetical protein NIES4071_91440 [Calothrix sp. NIES-4071]BAZ63411.1 hypothetical protein NIES4105_91370 [Calothrix sp. NIES-4105]
MIINLSKQLLINLFFLIKEIINVKWILDYIKYEFIYWRSWLAFALTPILKALGQLNNVFFKNNQKKSGLHRSHNVIELEAFTQIEGICFFGLESL